MISFRVLPLSSFLVLGIISNSAQAVTFLSDRGNSPYVNEALGGLAVPDHLAGSDYFSYVGEVILMPADQGILAGKDPESRGLASSNSSGLFGGMSGFVGFCIDSETSFLTSSSLSQTFDYLPLSFEAANAQYLSDGVAYYLADGLKRAAYLMETFFGVAHDSGDLEAAALQVAIWGALYDSEPNVSIGSGNYFVRNDTGLPSTQDEANQLINLVNSWYDEAARNNWGGQDYDPSQNVIFWVNPDNALSNQSIITLNIDSFPLTQVPEPTVGVSLMSSLLLALRRRR